MAEDFIADFAGRGGSLETCDLPEEKFVIKPFSMVIFGGAGDLSRRKLVPTIYGLFSEGELPDDFAVIGVGMPAMSDEEFRTTMVEAVSGSDASAGGSDRREEFAAHLHYVSGSFGERATYQALSEKLGSLDGACGGNAIYYTAVPPTIMPVVVEKLRDLKVCPVGEDARIIVEKPFGRDRRTAVELNRLLHSAFDESRIYRIDHYLGKETVQNIIFFRFSNTIFERLWNSQFIDNIQITVAEDMGIEQRGAFYEQAGVIRDIVQNHLMQLIALVAMEPPIGFEADYIRDEKVKVFRSIRPMSDRDVDRYTLGGQYGGGTVGAEEAVAYRAEEDVAADSTTPTFMAARFSIANWRWAGVPFYIRAGKRLARRVTEICIQYKQPPLRLFGRSCDTLEPNVLVLTVQPDERIFLRFGVKYPGAANKIYPVNVDFRYRDVFEKKSRPPYGRLLVDCMRGDLTLFVRQDGVEAMWEVIDPIIRRWESSGGAATHMYEAGSWGPLDSAMLLEREGRSWITT